MRHEKQRLSACVISFNRATIVPACLRALDFADEVILVDKTSTDGTRAVAAPFADRVVVVPWSPTVEETRAFAVSLCAHEWVLLLDDDELLSPGAGLYIQTELRNPQADIYAFPLRHYILGVHDERAYYWPEHHVRLFRRDVMTFGTTVHAGMTARSPRAITLPADSPACIHHLSHPDVAGWIERTNRYTSRPDRASDPAQDQPLAGYAHARIDHWLARSASTDGRDYMTAVALLRAVYDMVDALKRWEQQRGRDGHALFQDAIAALYPAAMAQPLSAGRSRRGTDARSRAPAAAPPPPAPSAAAASPEPALPRQ